MNIQMEEMHRAGHVGRAVRAHALSPMPQSQHLHMFIILEALCTLHVGDFYGRIIT